MFISRFMWFAFTCLLVLLKAGLLDAYAASERLKTSIILVSLAFVLFVYYRERRLSVLHSIPGPNPNFLLGNLGQLQGKPLYVRIQEWTKQYGKTWRYFEGPQSMIVSADLNFLQEVLVKQFHAFHGRKIFPLQYNPDSEVGIHMFLANGRRWKRLRKTLNPAFSSLNMRKLYDGIMKSALRQLRNNFNEKAASGVEFDIYEDFQQLTCDVTCTWAFGLSVESLKDGRDPFFVQLRKFFRNMDYFKKFPVVCAILFPELNDIIRWLFVKCINHGIMRNPMHFLLQRIERVIEMYEHTGEQRPTLLHMMLEKVCSWDELKTGEREGGISRKEVIEQCLLIIMAGFETSSTAMAYTAHCLAQNPEVQERLRSVLYSMVDSDEELSYEQLMSCEYLDWVIKEVLRMYPIATPVVNRRCSISTRVGDLYIPAGTHVVPDTWSIHYDPEIWGPEDPKVFFPERHCPTESRKRRLLEWQPFGVGPRQCLGQRVGLIEMKAALAMLVLRFEVVPVADWSMKLREGPSITPYDVRVRLVPR